MRHVWIVLAVAMLASPALPGCSTAAMTDASAPVGTAGTTATMPASESAQKAAEAIRAAIPEVTELITLTPSNDTNNLLGRPNGYSAAIVLVDSRASAACSTAKPGVDCGATIEQWPDAGSAQKRADHVKEMRGALPGLGPRYSALKGGLLLQVAPLLEPSIADAYRASFLGEGHR